jgi:hypothetical protein
MIPRLLVTQASGLNLMRVRGLQALRAESSDNSPSKENHVWLLATLSGGVDHQATGCPVS